MSGKAKASTHAEYLAGLDAPKRDALETLKGAILAAAPGAEECMSYGMPAFRLDGKVLVMFGATARHCAFYPGSGTAVAACSGDLEEYDTSKGTIRFDASRGLPASLVRKIVRFRIEENRAKS